MNKSGFAFHCHHDRLVEWVYDFDGRVKDIKNKPKEEQALRLRLFKLIPDDRIPPEVTKSGTACDEAWAVWTAAGAAYDKARAVDKTWAAYDEVEAAYNKAGAACGKIWRVSDKALLEHEEYFLELHKELCPDCPWDGETIF